jgi:hypothetical protein
MSYMHVENLYRPSAQVILLFRECYALEKLHGTSAHIAWRDGKVWLSPGGESADRFRRLFDEAALAAAFEKLGHPSVIVYGEAYGGSQQKQAWRYGKELRFAAFEVQIGEHFVNVPVADEIVKGLGLEFVHYKRIPTDLAAIDAERDAPSEQARRNGVEGDQPREGVVLRPLIELRDNSGSRIISKHKRDEERETKTPREVVDPAKLAVLTKATEIAEEWATPTRLEHILQKMPPETSIEKMREVIAAMTEDVLREGAGELVDSREARAAIGKRTATLFKERLQSTLKG